MADETTFGTLDYALFGVMLGISALIGIFYGCIKKQKTTGEFLMANRNLRTIPVAISILVSFMSAILILGTPAEMYTQGTEYAINMFGLFFAIILASLTFVPLLYPLRLTSSFEYLEYRFNSKAAKLTGTFIMIIQQILYMGIASYAPSTALEAVTGFPVWATIFTVGMVSTFYTALGGMKAVIWTDVFQSMVMLAGLLAILIGGTMKVGGMNVVWDINEQWDRINFFNFDPDPTTRHSFWSLIVGTTIGWMSTYGVNQASVQRYSALPSLRKARISVLLNIIGVTGLLVITSLCGIVMFAFYADSGCDPLDSGKVKNSNQLMPLFVLDVIGIPGLPGLFLSCLFSGALSTMSSCLNALAAVTWEDMLKPLLGDMKETGKTWITRFLVLFYGGAGIGFGFMAKNLGGTVLQASLSFTGAASGPVLGIFLLGACFPWANWIGAVVGGLLGLAFPLWISFGAYQKIGAPTPLPTPTWNCSVVNNTLSTTTAAVSSLTSTIPPPQELTGVELLYTVSYLWYPAIGMSTVIVVGLIVSAITGFSRPEDIDPKYIIPVFDRFFCCLPANVRRKLRCGYTFKSPEEITRETNIEKNIEMDTKVDPPDYDSYFNNKTDNSYNFQNDGFNTLETEGEYRTRL